jgi:chromosome segregation ATPase
VWVVVFLQLGNNHVKLSLSNEKSNILCLSTKRKEAAETAGTSDVHIQNLVAEEEQWEAAEPVLEHKLGDIQDEKENLDSELLLEVEFHEMSPPQYTSVSPCEIQELGAPQVIGLQSEKGRLPNGENQERNVLSSSLKEYISLSSGDGVCDNHLSNNLKQELLKTRAECDNLRTKLRETDDTLLSVRMELEKSVVHYQEAEIERRREREENRKRIIALEDELRSTDEKIMHRQIQVEKFESELETLMSMVTETKQQLGGSETDRRNEREQCEMEELEQARLDEASDFRDEPEHIRRMCDESERLGNVSSMHTIGFSEIDSPDMHLDDLSLDTITEEVDLFIAHCLNQMGTLALEMKSLRKDISDSFFQMPHTGLQQDVEKIFQAHRDEISVLIIKIAGLEELLEERSSKVSILQELLDAAQETLQSFTSAQEKSELELLSSEASLEAAKAELEMSEAAVRELLNAARETDTVILDLKTNLQQRIEHETKVEAEVKVCQQQAQDVQLEMDELHATVGLLQQELATKEEFIKELENSIRLLEKTGSSETEQKEEAINQLQGELNSRNNEICMLLDQQCKLEGDITKKIQELGLIKEELGTMNARVVQAVEERDGLCKQVQNMQFEMDQLKITVKSLQEEIATKEEFIKGLEKTGNSKTQQVEAIIQLQEELNSRNVELRLLVDQQYKLEGQITKKTEELGLIKEELGAMNTSVVQAVEERDILCKQIEDWKSKVMSLEATVVEQANEINCISSELHSEQALVKEHKLAADKARQVTWVLRMCALTLSCFDFHRCAYCGTCTHTFQRLQIV